MAYLEEDLKELARKYGVEMKTSVSGVRGEDILSVLSKPSSEPYWKLKLKGGLSYDQIAAVLGCTRAQVRTWIYRARRSLEDRFRKEGLIDRQE